MKRFGRHAGTRTLSSYGWPLIADRYLEVIRRAARPPGDTAASG
jgi:hypothetical protein